ncbi:trans-sulfuration enzyme family protein [Pseudobacteriovorax antillogorgiicola]|uniref:O-acetylhomoserine sulfhydrylase n=1 Tax=Pseudobacteriovorax antillogorgiicola TaxID=1513793 RepID=A0A1Y6CM99_9BACT|nr:aminotransferase class I/II-fold pyridoxal phosphate-dependent enzyme [Pseudobacteriovorax antillogorgiicola]TCS45013.1 methionine-gamma-lyase [Pseudobacteriovorax antillogorgiicola]SMF76375.1 O-acetylhomoserine sulfhydrylase [Pseudobacteriovorax antillogorgiicola]
MNLETLTNHFQLDPIPHDNRPLVSPIYQSVKFTFPKLADVKGLFEGQRPGYFYSRYRNPTVFELEQLLAKAQGTEAGLATSSGVGAISTALFSLLRQGDKIIYFIESYRPTRILIEKTLKKFGVEGIKLSLDDLDQINEAAALPETRFMIWESPTNPQLKVPNNKELVAIAQRHQLTTILDNTFAGFHKNQDLDVDLYIHSLTKYAGGHSDVMGGALLGREPVIREIFEHAVEIGSVLDPHAAFLILRGMKTYRLRYERQAQNALALAVWLQEQAQVGDVFYPGLDYLKDQLPTDGGTVVMFNFKNKSSSLEAFIDGLKLFTLSASLGSTESLVAPALYFYGMDLSEDQRQRARLDQTSVRLSLGIESIEDLKSDIAQSLAAL